MIYIGINDVWHWGLDGKGRGTSKEDFESGIRKTVEWYLNNEAWCENIQNGSYQLERIGVIVK